MDDKNSHGTLKETYCTAIIIIIIYNIAPEITYGGTTMETNGFVFDPTQKIDTTRVLATLFLIDVTILSHTDM